MLPTNTIILDLETLDSTDNCRHCGLPADYHDPGTAACPVGIALTECTFTPIGWHNRPALGLSIGCAYASTTGRPTFFDVHTLEETMRAWVEQQAHIVTFNGFQFDLPLLRGILRRRAAMLRKDAPALRELCDAFKVQCGGPGAYDLLQEIWAADPSSKRVKGINGLDALAQANGLPGKTGSGAQAPLLWAAGRHAEVVNYCLWDVYLTKALFEQVLRGEPLRRLDGSTVLLPLPPWEDR